jgi:hypothetical protein
VTRRAAGFTLRERLAIYEEYLDKPLFFPAALRALADKLQNDIGKAPYDAVR